MLCAVLMEQRLCRRGWRLWCSGRCLWRGGFLHWGLLPGRSFPRGLFHGLWFGGLLRGFLRGALFPGRLFRPALLAAAFRFTTGFAAGAASAALALRTAAHRFRSAATIRARPATLSRRFGATVAGGPLSAGAPSLRRRSARRWSISFSFA